VITIFKFTRFEILSYLISTTGEVYAVGKIAFQLHVRIFLISIPVSRVFGYSFYGKFKISFHSLFFNPKYN